MVSLPSAVSKGINAALEVLIATMKQQDQSKRSFNPPYHLFDGFMMTDHSAGVQYCLHMSVHRGDVAEPVEYVAEVFMPFQGAGMARFHEASSYHQRTVHLIINIHQTSNLKDFLGMYEAICIKEALNTHLHVVLFGDNARARAQIGEVVSSHPGQPISLYELADGIFSHSVGYDHVINKLDSGDLLVLFDYSFTFTGEFIRHVRMNTVKGHQAYFPILFSFYKPELVRRFVQHPLLMAISADTGFFLRYNYQVVAIYKSDYDTVKGVELANTGGGVAKNDDVKLVNKALSSNIYVMRALEPSLRRNYRMRSCHNLTGSSHTACMNSKADTIGSKKILGSLLITHDLLDEV